MGPVPDFCADIVEIALSRLNVDASRSLAWAGLEFGIQPREVVFARALSRRFLVGRDVTLYSLCRLVGTGWGTRAPGALCLARYLDHAWHL